MSELVRAEEFDISIITNAKVAKRPHGLRSRGRDYVNLICAIDTETSYIKALNQNILYVWQIQIDEICTVIGRDILSLKNFLDNINSVLSDKTYLLIFCHNLSYDWQFIRNLYDTPIEKVFAVRSRKILKFDIGEHIEIRCSYLHCNMSLDAYTAKYNVEHKKLSGTKFDYSKERLPSTVLSKYELDYITNDVLGLVEAIKAEMELEKDCLYTFPLTSTGYIRRDIKKALKEWDRNRLQSLFPDVELYKILREAFRGGNTHANKLFVKSKDFPLPPWENVKSADRSSSYPDVIVNYKFPMTPFKKVLKEVTEEQLFTHYMQKYAVVARCKFTEIQLQDMFYPCPYISLDKCVIPKEKRKNRLIDNGRIMKAEEITLSLTDIDLEIIKSQYKWKQMEVLEIWFSRYDYLPDTFRDLVRKYYEQKTQLKGVEGQQLYYDKFKNLINACYGCMAQDCGKPKLLYHQENIGDDLFLPEENTLQERLENFHATMPYQWGVWVTARARQMLQVAIDAVHYNEQSEFVYTDTDSVKYIGVFDWETINKSLRDLSISNNAFALDKNGITHYLGIFEQEETMRYFETMGAKSYLYVIASGKNKGLHITIAGVPKKKGAKELARKARIERKLQQKDITVFDLYKDGFVFQDGVTITEYNDYNSIETVEIGGEVVPISSNIVIKDSTHEIGLSADYKWLLGHLDKKQLAKALDF